MGSQIRIGSGWLGFQISHKLKSFVIFIGEFFIVDYRLPRPGKIIQQNQDQHTNFDGLFSI